jgi:methionine synthase II (cobalamin-independent)
MKKKISDLQIGDKVELEDGSIVRANKIDKGWFTSPSKMITWSNGKWSCFYNSDQITVLV